MNRKCFECPEHIDGESSVKDASDDLQVLTPPPHHVFLVRYEPEVEHDAHDGFRNDTQVEEDSVEGSRFELAPFFNLGQSHNVDHHQ